MRGREVRGTKEAKRCNRDGRAEEKKERLAQKEN